MDRQKHLQKKSVEKVVNLGNNGLLNHKALIPQYLKVLKALLLLN
jgi:hypothetical protein